MGKHRKTWSHEEKLAIVNFYKNEGAGKTSREFNVSSTSIYQWARIFEHQGSDGLSNKSNLDKDKEIQRLCREIQAYKEIIAEKELALRIKDALLKKKVDDGN